MLTLLRKFRKSLIESGSARKYLLYAVGEIVLVKLVNLMLTNAIKKNASEKRHTS